MCDILVTICDILVAPKLGRNNGQISEISQLFCNIVTCWHDGPNTDCCNAFSYNQLGTNNIYNLNDILYGFSNPYFLGFQRWITACVHCTGWRKSPYTMFDRPLPEIFVLEHYYFSMVTDVITRKMISQKLNLLVNADTINN